eukprot:UN01205
MYGKCTSTTTTSPPIPSVPPTPAPVYGWEKYEKEYEGKMGGDNANAEQQQQSTFCKCLAEEIKTGKSYASSQNAFSKCIDKANGNDASHWEKVAEKYQQNGSPRITTTSMSEISSTFVQNGYANAILFDGVNDDESFGNVAFYVTFIGSCFLLFICACFIKQSFRKWKQKDYERINNQTINTLCQRDDECGFNGINYQPSSNRFAGWNQYSSV